MRSEDDLKSSNEKVIVESYALTSSLSPWNTVIMMATFIMHNIQPNALTDMTVGLQVTEKQRSSLRQARLAHRQREAANEEHTAALHHHLLSLAGVNSGTRIDALLYQVTNVPELCSLWESQHLYVGEIMPVVRSLCCARLSMVGSQPVLQLVAAVLACAHHELLGMATGGSSTFLDTEVSQR